MFKLYSFEKFDFWLTVRMSMCNYGKLYHIQTTYLWFSISLHIHKTDSEVKMRVHLSAYPTTPSTRSIYYLKANHLHIIKELIYFSGSCGGKYRNYKNVMNLWSHKHEFGISAEWVFFATSYCKSPYDNIGGAVKMTCFQAKPPKFFE